MHILECKILQTEMRLNLFGNDLVRSCLNISIASVAVNAIDFCFTV